MIKHLKLFLGLLVNIQIYYLELVVDDNYDDSLFVSIKDMSKNPNTQYMYMQSTGKVLAIECYYATDI